LVHGFVETQRVADPHQCYACRTAEIGQHLSDKLVQFGFVNHPCPSVIGREPATPAVTTSHAGAATPAPSFLTPDLGDGRARLCEVFHRRAISWL
jgi:hypothetical protein